MSMLKDRAFAKIYAVSGKPSMPFPKLSLAMFAVRDAATVAASFTLPPRITPWLKERSGLPHDVARGIVQLLTPLSAQIFTVPLHLAALDLYNNPQNAERAAFIRREYTKTLFARWGRILPAFGIGGVINLQMQVFSSCDWFGETHLVLKGLSQSCDGTRHQRSGSQMKKNKFLFVYFLFEAGYGAVELAFHSPCWLCWGFVVVVCFSGQAPVFS